MTKFDDAVCMVPEGVTLVNRASLRTGAAVMTDCELQGLAELETAAVHRGFDSDLEDEERRGGPVYLTDAHLEWERHYLRRIAKRMHRLMCAELTREEEVLFMLFVSFDVNLDGIVKNEEAKRFFAAMEENTSNGSKPVANPNGKVGFVDADGSVSFIGLLKWFSDCDQGISATLQFNFSSLTVGLLGSGILKIDTRLDTLSREKLQQNIIGYRRLLGEVRQLHDERTLARARQTESVKGLEGSMQAYYDALASQFADDDEHLFELFAEVDVSGNMALEEDEVSDLLGLLDTAATEGDRKRYIAEINLSDGPLTFVSLLDWWDQARSVPNSLVAEKGAALVAGVRARAVRRKFGGMFSETCVQAQWRKAKEANRLQALRQVYVRTFYEVREYKLERDLQALEEECAKL